MLYGHAGADVEYTYQWFKDGAKLTGATGKTYAVKNVAHSGTYTLVITAKDGFAEQTASVTVTVNIGKLKIDLSTLLWSKSEFPYLAGTAREVTLLIPENLEIANLTFAYTDNTAEAPGTYTARATVANYDSDNCEVVGTVADHEWTISNKSYAVIDHFGGEIVVTSEAGFPTGYTLHADWLGDNTLPDGLVSGATCTLISGHLVYFTDADGNKVSVESAVSVSFTIPESGMNENLKLVLLKNNVPTEIAVTRTEDGHLTFTLDAFDKDAAYLIVSYRFPLTIDTSDDVNISYDPETEDIKLTVTPHYYNGTLTFTYQWYRADGTLIEGATEATLRVPMAAGTAKYFCRVSVTDGYATVTEDSALITVTVTQKTLDTSRASIPDFIYRLFAEDPTIEILAKMLENLPEGVIVTIDTDSQYKASDVGTYTVRVLFTLAEEYAENYELDVTARTLTWKINPYNIRIGTPGWNYSSPLTYKGSDYTFRAPDLEANSHLEVTYRNNTAKNAGSYTVTVTVTPANENCVINGEASVSYTETFIIEPKTISVDLIEWAEKTFYYDGEVHRPTLKDLSSYRIAGVNESLAEILVIRDYAGVFASDVLPDGATPYTVTAYLAVKEGNTNYRLTASKKVLEWNITPKPLDIEHVELDENLFDYDGTKKTVSLRKDSIPAELLAVLDPSTEITATEKGYHSVTVHFTLKEGLNYLNYSYDSSINLSYRIVTPINPADFVFTGDGLVYNGNEQTVPALSFGDFAALVRIAGTTGTVRATDAGDYEVTYTFALTNEGLYRLTEESYTYTWSIAKKKITVGTLTWDYTTAFTYDPDRDAFTVALAGALDENIVVAYENASAKDAGTYLARAILTPVSDNYEIVMTDPDSAVCEWTILQKIILIPAVEWQDNIAFLYDGAEKNVLLKTVLPDTVTVEYLNNLMTDAGTYRATATLLAKDKNYRVVIGDTDQNVATLDWEITPITVIVGALEWNFAEREFVYSTDARTFLITNLPEHITALYENNVIGNVGNYTVTVTLVADKNYKIEGTETATLTYTVTPKIITVNASDLRWVTNAASERYDGMTHTYELVGVPEHVVILYQDNVKAAIGNYVAGATLEAESANYTLIVNGNIPTKAWSIVKGKYDMSGVKFEDKTVEYTGQTHAFTISGKLPAGVSVTYSMTGFRNAGVYVVTATFKGSDNYEEIPSMTATLTITRVTYTITAGGADTLIITAL
ncbi:MAG TPA: hypothetical protein DDY70_02420, partial [Clostridiales bacterium]|nr:hypothetical protein [Clostridiales bacterium]